VPDDFSRAAAGAMRNVASGMPARMAEGMLLASAPAVALWVMHFPPIAQNGLVDPYVYTGYINNFEDLVQRYGVTYYSVRFGLIAPAELAAAMFGPVGGYFVLRYVYALLAGVPFYVLARQRFGTSTAIAALALLLTSPYFARTLLWDHPDAAGVPLLFAAICFLLIEHRRRWLLDSCAALCAALAVHSHVFVAAPLAIFVALWATLSFSWRRGARRTFAPLATLVSGIALITALIAAYYRWRVGVTDMFSVTIGKSVELATGGMAAWRTPGVDWINSQWHVLTPVALCVMALLVCSRRRPAFHEAVIWSSAAGATAFSYVVQFLFDGNSLELFYYFSYLLPFAFLLLALVVGGLLSGAHARLQWSAAALVASAAIGPWVLHSLGRWTPYPTRAGQYLVTVCAAGAVLILWRTVPRFRAVSLMCSAAALGFMLFSSFSTSMYARMIDARGHANRNEIDVYRVAVQLIERVPRMSSNPGAVGFWYSNIPANGPIRSIQSTYLWGFSKVQGESAGLPILEPPELDRLRRMELRWLVLLAEEREGLDRGREVLRTLGVQHEPVSSSYLSAGTYGLFFQLLELR
jgi:hypothetical protein